MAGLSAARRMQVQLRHGVPTSLLTRWLGFAFAMALLCHEPVEGARKYPEIFVNDQEKTVEQEMRDVNVTITLNPRDSFLYSERHPTMSLNWYQVSAGGFHTCAIRRYFEDSDDEMSTNRLANGGFDHLNPTDAPGMIRCFGSDKYGQLRAPLLWPDNPPGKEGDANCPTGEGGSCFNYDSGWRNISAGWLHTCGITADGTLYCWGNNRDGQVGREDLVEGSITCEDEFDKCVAKFKGKWALREFGGVQAGKTHTCGIKCADNPPQDIMYQDIFCQNGSKPCSFPEPIPSTCTQGKVVCWGGDDFEQVSGMSKAFVDQGLQPGQEPDDFLSVCAATSHSCAVRETGFIYCWGLNKNNRLTVPTAYATQLWTAVKCKGAFSCAMVRPRQVGEYKRSAVRCWGHNSVGQATVPRFSRQVLTPVNDSSVPKVSLLLYDREFRYFDAGEYHTCALWGQTADEQECNFDNQKAPALNGDCWGEETYGQSYLPLRPLNHQAARLCDVMQWKTISTGSYHTCAITHDDSGEFCATENQCTEYPAPLGTNGCDGCPIIRCPRGVRQKSQGGGNCVPDRTNHLRCFGLSSDGQVDSVVLSKSSRPTPSLAAVSAAALSFALCLVTGRGVL